jgi:hypothetical protein
LCSLVTRCSDGHFQCRRIEFWNNEGGLSIFTQGDVPPALEERYTLLRYFAKYMDANLTEGVAGHRAPALGNESAAANPEFSRVSIIPHMRRWMRSSVAIIMHLSDGTVQVS